MEERVEFVGADVFVASDAFLEAVDYFEGGVDSHVGGDENLLEFVEEIVIDTRATHGGTFDFGEDAFLGLFETAVKVFFLFFLREQTEKCHI